MENKIAVVRTSGQKRMSKRSQKRREDEDKATKKKAEEKPVELATDCWMICACSRALPDSLPNWRKIFFNGDDPSLESKLLPRSQFIGFSLSPSPSPSRPALELAGSDGKLEWPTMLVAVAVVGRLAERRPLIQSACSGDPTGFRVVLGWLANTIGSKLGPACPGSIELRR
jgi:hypothetical protein